jgi:hypothetical protein
VVERQIAMLLLQGICRSPVRSWVISFFSFFASYHPFALQKLDTVPRPPLSLPAWGYARPSWHSRSERISQSARMQSYKAIWRDRRRCKQVGPGGVRRASSTTLSINPPVSLHLLALILISLTSYTFHLNCAVGYREDHTDPCDPVCQVGEDRGGGRGQEIRQSRAAREQIIGSIGRGRARSV